MMNETNSPFSRTVALTTRRVAKQFSMGSSEDCALAGARRGRDWGPLVVFGFFLIGLPVPASFSANAPSTPTLENYLQQLHYEPVPLKLNELYQPFVQADLGDGKKKTLLVDTGWALTTLQEGAARNLKTLGEMGVVLEDSARGPITNVSQLVLEKLTLGRAQFVNQPVNVKKLDVEYMTLPYEGVLGFDFMSRNSCLLDCYKQRLYVRGSKPTVDESAALAETLRRSGFAEIPMRFRGLLCIAAQVNGQRIRLVVDTGASFSLIEESAATRLGLTALKTADPKTGTLIRDDVGGWLVLVNRSGKRKVRVTTLNTLQVGPRKWENVHFGLAQVEEWDIGRPGTPQADLAGFFGPDYLTSKGALIDLATRTLWLRPEKPAAPAKGTSR